MALRFPRFSQGLAQDPTTRRIWFGIATAHDFESHDDITEERLYQNNFASQELIETLAWAHERTPLANLIRWRDKPVALSIVQARLVGLAHFSVGYIFTYAAFLIASTSGKFG
ncbi:Photosystem I P700 chlorophyll a apoprotein A2 [Helianthus annuus]|uniref:Photosystem I PsaA/PsaB n=1 Tax=Helianthus annuus TaxID=4232 RepID=A0A251TES5_HELAN|nr:putative photosystem I PsaA/PsaB [Helianthus annuus]KAJ0512291.1 Photosystem I P700 chlorophyll a apoprotein A2 [Helianthus annuus]KAJ0528394.1 Photosystem I P700 chlorophyll a apoprotein A2 [Helianthus annuus]KAJ0877630.1 Photosystem I P700 chlorophyll a apoprotein A2 [Helianthus annuus]